MQFKISRTLSLALIVLPLSLATNQTALIQETRETIDSLYDAVASYKGGLPGIPTLVLALINTWIVRGKLNAYEQATAVYNGEDSQAIVNTSATVSSALVDLLNLATTKVPLVAAVGQQAVAHALIQPMYKQDTAYASALMSKLSPDDAALIQGQVDDIVLAYEALFRATASA